MSKGMWQTEHERDCRPVVRIVRNAWRYKDVSDLTHRATGTTKSIHKARPRINFPFVHSSSVKAHYHVGTTGTIKRGKINLAEAAQNGLAF